jgi:hypothetical protein
MLPSGFGKQPTHLNKTQIDNFELSCESLVYRHVNHFEALKIATYTFCKIFIRKRTNKEQISICQGKIAATLLFAR